MKQEAIKFSREKIQEMTGTVSLLTTIISAVWLAVAGENILIWAIYLVSSTTGITNNFLVKNRKMMLIFVIFTITNIIAILRLLS